ncbi:MAG: DUF1524 domain-containing protein [Acutalibacteraceae bacterium]
MKEVRTITGVMKDLIINGNMIDKFKNYLRLQEKSQNTIEKYMRDIKMFWRYIGTQYVTKELAIKYLTLSAYNSDYSNLTFLKKKNMPGKGFVHSKLQLNCYLKKLDKWDEEEIRNRADYLFDRALKI